MEQSRYPHLGYSQGSTYPWCNGQASSRKSHLGDRGIYPASASSNLNPNAAAFQPPGYFYDDSWNAPPAPPANNFGGNESMPYAAGAAAVSGANTFYNSGFRTFQNSNFVTVSGDSLRERLDEQLRRESYECMICCEKVRWHNSIWSCQQCYHVFHLKCVKKWAKTSTVDEPEHQRVGWRCPGCQHVSAEYPKDYYCFCGQVQNPSPGGRGYELPHSCGMICKKHRQNSDCPHTCTILCHPGACPPCPKTLEKFCLCGLESKHVRCGSEPFQCGKACNKLLNCEIHACVRVCHSGPCDPCRETVVLNCFCGKSQKDVPCSFESMSTTQYVCEQMCGKLLSCGLHVCQQRCHEGACASCPKSPSVLVACSCGKTSLADLGVSRVSCTDPVPACNKFCHRKLNCGPSDNPHKCNFTCHTDSCPPCPLTTSTVCRCGAVVSDVPCSEYVLFDAENPYLCTRKCTKKRLCRQHKCNEVCCVDEEHICTLVCGRKLPCGQHSCEMLCHTGKCRPCTNTSFDELRCFCGEAVIYPPVPCGTRPPVCTELCTRDHACDHPVGHNCHSEPNCPPCIYLTQKLCYGGHEVRRNIPCYLNDVSCGKMCAKELPCVQHRCTKNCHPGECHEPDQKCVQPCLVQKVECGHPCGLPCHVGTQCPDAPCLTMVTVSCACGRRTSRLSCADVDRKYSSYKNGLIAKATKNNEMIEFDKLERSNSFDRYKCLDCDDECSRIERNRRLAAALQIDNADVLCEAGPPLYTDFLKNQYKSNAEYLLGLEKTFTDLIASLTTAKTKSHVFPPMNRDQRRLVHEYAPFFLIETLSYDAEPIRNVVATAVRGKSIAPTVLLSTLMNKDTKPLSAVRVAGPTSFNTQNSKSMPAMPGSMKTLSSNSLIFKRAPPI